MAEAVCKEFRLCSIQAMAGVPAAGDERASSSRRITASASSHADRAFKGAHAPTNLIAFIVLVMPRIAIILLML